MQVARAEIDAEQVRRAIQRGIDYLKREQAKDGSWSDQPGLPGGISGLCTLALLTAGEPLTDPSMRAAVDHMRKVRVKMTYSVALQTMVLCNAEPLKDLLLIRDNVHLLETNQLTAGDKKGAWGYSDIQGAGDNSNSQFALLALNQAERAGVAVKDETWRRVLGYWQRTQNFDGSWGYMEGLNGTGSMTCAGISAMVIASRTPEPGRRRSRRRPRALLRRARGRRRRRSGPGLARTAFQRAQQSRRSRRARSISFTTCTAWSESGG